MYIGTVDAATTKKNIVARANAKRKRDKSSDMPCSSQADSSNAHGSYKAEGCSFSMVCV